MTILYSLPGCVQCNATETFLQRNGIDYDHVDLSTDDSAADFVKSLGYQSAPVVVTDDGHWSGFRYDLLKNLTNP